jgi:predicted PurR-regulated permease PerM
MTEQRRFMGGGDPRLANLFRAVALVVLIGWLLVIGKDLLIPVVAAVIAVYVLTTAAEAMGRLPVLRHVGSIWRHTLVLVIFILAFVGLGLVIAVTVNQLIELAPVYRANLETLAGHLAAYVGVERHPTWEDIREATIGRMDITALLTSLVGSVTSLGATIFIIIIYAAFLMGERFSFPAKLAAAFPRGDQAERTEQLISDINGRIGHYLAVKTLINIILGVISYLILWAMDIDFALFWAVLIALFNYIPYVGSLVAVMLPVALSLAQFGSVATTLLLAALLTTAQVYTGNILEPRMFSRQLNLSAFVILVALSLWTALWGLPGAILAVPLTSVMAIVFAALPETRFIAVLLADHIELAEEPGPRPGPTAGAP